MPFLCCMYIFLAFLSLYFCLIYVSFCLYLLAQTCIQKKMCGTFILEIISYEKFSFSYSTVLKALDLRVMVERIPQLSSRQK
jgi:hypothetical protein